jgi:formate dehydrogenase major subunit
MPPGVVYTTFHYPTTGANVVTTDNSDWATNCPEYKVTAVQAHKVTRMSDWQQHFEKFTEEQIEHLRRAQSPETAGPETVG